MTETDLPQANSELSTEELTQEVGHRVRSVRSRRGLTRKTLAYHSDVSERYLAQLERGTANVSLALLARISKALGVRIGSLLPGIVHLQAHALVHIAEADLVEHIYGMLE